MSELDEAPVEELVDPPAPSPDVVPEPSPVVTPDEVNPVDLGDVPCELDVSAGPVDGRPEDPIGVVEPGDFDGLAALVVRSVGMGDGGRYVGAAVDLVKARQEAAGLEPTGIVSGASWGLVLRTPKHGEAGHEVRLLRRLHGLTEDGVFDDELEHTLGAAGVRWG